MNHKLIPIFLVVYLILSNCSCSSNPIQIDPDQKTSLVTALIALNLKVDHVKLDFYGGDRQMGLGDLLWKKNWVTITSNLDSSNTYQLILKDQAGAEVRSSELRGKSGEISFGTTNFDRDAKQKLISLAEGKITVELVEGSNQGGKSVLEDQEISFTKGWGKVRNWRDLQAIGGVSDGVSANVLNDDYVLMNHIDLPEPSEDGGLAGIDRAGNPHTMPVEGFDPIGDKDNPFRGTFNGNGKIIKNLSIDRGSMDDVGLFSLIQGTGSDNVGVRDLILELSSYGDTDIAINGKDKTGVLAGWIQKTKVTEVRVLGVGRVKGAVYVGGLVGYIEDSSVIRNSYTTGDVTGNDDLGGLVGVVTSTGSLTITKSYWDTNTTGQLISAQSRGDGKSTLDMKLEVTFTDWDFFNT